MESRFLDRIIKKLVGYPVSWGTEYNLVLSETFYEKFQKELEKKYGVKGLPVTGIPDSNGNTKIGVKVWKVLGYTVTINISHIIETWRLIPTKKYDITDEQDPDSFDRGTSGQLL